MKTSPVNDGLDRRTGFFFALNPVETGAEVRTCSLVCTGTSLKRREEKREERKGKYSESFIWSFILVYVASPPFSTYATDVLWKVDACQ